ncbi:DNA-binding protein [Methylobacterium soli]|uniref:DNA-binding protein n=1 Tax=Methylobacterium soli TaxID=553447 RepID=A0A6L3SRM4_9HYPH|nr:DNA-binding protein [Methylobacterium soli]KAB1075456.1 DNA-binding protein [Methylobacterium soli]
MLTEKPVTTSPEVAPADLLYGVPAIATHLGIRLQQAHHQIRKGALPTFRVGGVICARRTTIANWLAEREDAARKGRDRQ